MKKTLEGLVCPQGEVTTTAGDTDLREAMMSAFEKVVIKGENKGSGARTEVEVEAAVRRKHQEMMTRRKTGGKLWYWYCIN